TETAVRLMRAADAEQLLIRSLRATEALLTASASAGPAKLAQAGELVREEHYDGAAPTLDPLIASDPHNPALHFLMGYIRQQQENWDRAFDEYSTSRDELPGSSDTHSRLAYVFYRYDDADKAVAEARTALSIDPTNAEAYRYLGLGLYASHKDAGALHAFEESLAREPKRAEVYYDIAILRDKGDATAASAAYRKAVALN